jgi:hypothetical protein
MKTAVRTEMPMFKNVTTEDSKIEFTSYNDDAIDEIAYF